MIKNNLKDKMPNVNNYWGQLNNTSPEDHHFNSHEYVYYHCLKTEHPDVLRKVRDIYKKPDACMVCAGKIVIVGYNDALSANPRLIDVWDESNEKQPTEYSKQSGQKFNYKCLICHNVYPRKIADAVKNINECSVCAGKIVVEGFNDLYSCYPKLMEEWSDKNTIDPRTIAHQSKTVVMWECNKCHYEWSTPVYSRTGTGRGCAVCAGQKVLLGVNSIYDKSPLMTSQWDYEKNYPITPKDVYVASRTKYWWRCENNHEWYLAPGDRWWPTKNKVAACKRCVTNKVSYYENLLVKYYENKGIRLIQGSRNILKNNNKELDIYLPDYNIAIEFNGDYWHSNTIIHEKYNMSAYDYHKIKYDECADNGIQLLYVWYSDFNMDQDKFLKLLDDAVFNKNISSELLKFSIEGADDNVIMGADDVDVLVGED